MACNGRVPEDARTKHSSFSFLGLGRGDSSSKALQFKTREEEDPRSSKLPIQTRQRLKGGQMVR